MPRRSHERRHGEGSIREVRPGVYRAWRARVHRQAGTSTRPSRTFQGPGAAERAALWARGDPEPTVLYVGQWLERWLSLREPRLRVRTRESYRAHVKWCGELRLRPLADVTEEDWQQLANRLLDERALGSVRNWRATISSALQAAVPRHLPSNPLAHVELPRASERRVRAFTADGLVALLQAAAGHRHELYLRLSLGTGLRLGEIRGLTWDRVDMAERTLLIDSALDQVSSAVGPTKSGRIRTVDLPDQLLPLLRAQRARQQPGERYVIGSGRRGRPLGASTLRDFMVRLCERAGVRLLGPHALRHTFASHSLDAGVPLKEVSETLGHSNVAITAQVYSHAVKRRRRQAADAMGSLLESLSPGNGSRIGTRDAV